jgi:hypothetical protein
MNKIIGAFALRGENSLEAYDGELLEHGDAAIVFTSVDTKTYTLDADSAEPEDSDLIIAPSVNPGPKRWKWVSTEGPDGATIDYVNNRVANASNIQTGMIPSSVLPPLAITTVQVAANQTAMLALTTQEGDVVVRSDLKKSYIRNANNYGTMGDFTELQTPTDLVLSVNSKTGSVVLNLDNIGNGATYVRSKVEFTQALKDLINGVSGNYLRSNATTTHTAGTLVCNIQDGESGASTGYSTPGVALYQPTINADAFMSMHVGGDYACQFGLDGTTNDLFVGGWSKGAVKYKIHHEGNAPIATSSTANTLVKRDGSGDTQARYSFASFMNMTHGQTTRNTDSIFYSSTDSYIRKNTKAGFLESLGLTGLDNLYHYGIGSNGRFFYMKYGLLLNWGYVTATGSSTTQYFSVPYPSADVQIFLTPFSTSSGSQAPKVLTRYNDRFTYGASSNNDNWITVNCFWLAIGPK